jgi:tRNA modification GTPase
VNPADETIVAISTPPGRGGIGIVRLSGPEARAVAEPLLRLRHVLEPGRTRFAEVVDGDSVLDEAVVTWFAGPRSYTGEDVVEIAAHGSPVLLDWLLRRCVAGGARLAEPGEFTQRAFLAGRLDLTQAEAVGGLIEATTLAQARTAAMQLGGGLSRQVAPVKRELIWLIAALEAGVDFAEDDLEVMAEAEIAGRMAAIETPLRALEASFAYGRVLREGFRLAIVGRPNAGKSSLFNRLVGRERAIVTAKAGTTRDPVAERVEMAGIPVELIDTAGLRVSGDEAEEMGVAKSREAMAEADVVLLVVAADGELHREDRAVIEAAAGRRLIVAANKIDLVSQGVSWRAGLAAEVVETSAVAVSGLAVSGIDRLREAILEAVQATPVAADTVAVTNLRQQGAIRAALTAIDAAKQGLAEVMPHEMLLLDLHEALGALDGLTGTTHIEKILEVVFGSFCIGK